MLFFRTDRRHMTGAYWVKGIIASYVMLLCNREVCELSTVLLHSYRIAVALLEWRTLEIVKLSVACSRRIRRNHFCCNMVSVLAIISNCRLSDNVDGQIVATCMIDEQLLSKPLRFCMSPAGLSVTSTFCYSTLPSAGFQFWPDFLIAAFHRVRQRHDERFWDCMTDRPWSSQQASLSMQVKEDEPFLASLCGSCVRHTGPLYPGSGCHGLMGTDFSTLSETSAVIFHQMCWWWKRTC